MPNHSPDYETVGAWRLTLATTLATIASELGGLKEQVTRQNGNVAKLWEKYYILEKQISQHEAAQEATDATASRTSGRWEGWLKFAVGPLLGLLAGLLLKKLGA